jgi:hypothetical protein
MSEDARYVVLLRILLELLYSFSKQYVSFYDREIKDRIS